MQALLSQPVQEEHHLVFYDNWLALNVFLAVQTQWRVIGGMGPLAYTGLDYTALKATMDLLGVAKKLRAALFEDVRELEASWLEAKAEIREQGQA